MNIVDRLLELSPYSLSFEEKQKIMLEGLKELTVFHYRHCELYSKLIKRIYGGLEKINFETIYDTPFIPISLFKTHELMSIPKKRIFKTLTSSGTSGSSVSKIFLDSETATLQSKVLVKIVQHFIGNNRLPLIILDTETILKDRLLYSARGAGIRGFLQFGYDPLFLFSEDMSFDMNKLKDYLIKHKDKPILFFGFTSIVWLNFVAFLEKQHIRLNLPESILIHGGGWKKMEDYAVTKEDFKKRIYDILGIKKVFNFYGMAEQVGSIYFENDRNFFSPSNFSEIIIRDPVTFMPQPNNKSGIIQILSILPRSYPGHSILTEDMGVIRDVFDSNLMRKGQSFEILGRIPKTEIRGCSDTYEPVTNFSS